MSATGARALSATGAKEVRKKRKRRTAADEETKEPDQEAAATIAMSDP